MGLCGRDCNQCGLQVYCQGCSLCEQPFCGRQCSRCFSLCPERPAAFAFLKQAGGCKVQLQGNNIGALPIFIPVVPDHMPVPTGTQGVIGVHGGKMLTSNGENVARVYRQKGLQGALNLKNPVKGILQFYVKDRAIEGLWDNRKELYRQLLEFPWEAVVAPNFSVYEDAPRISHLYNIKRSSVAYNEMLDAGLPAIPDISWYSRVDLGQWIREINNSNIKTIAFSFQTVSTGSKPANTWKHYLMGYQYLMQNIPEDVAVVIAGISSPKRLKVLRAAGSGKNRVSVLNQTAYLQSRRGVLAGNYGGNAGGLDKEQIFRKNIEFYMAAYQEIGLEGKENAKVEK